MENDRLLEQLNQLFDNKLTPIREELGTINGHLDLVATTVARVDDRLEKVEGRLETVDEGLQAVIQTQGQHGDQLGRIERKLVSHDDRLDVLEAKTAHLPTPPRG